MNSGATPLPPSEPLEAPLHSYFPESASVYKHSITLSTRGMQTDGAGTTFTTFFSHSLHSKYLSYKKCGTVRLLYWPRSGAGAGKTV